MVTSWSTPPKPHHLPRRVWIPIVVLVTLLALLVGAQILAQPLAKHYTQKGLDAMKGYKGTFSRVRVNLFALSYTIDDLKIWQQPARDQDQPLLYAHEIKARVMLRHLLRFNLVGVAHVGQPKLVWAYTEHHKRELKRVAHEVREALPPLERIDDALRSIIPFKLGRIEVRGGEVVIIDGEVPSRPTIWLHKLELAVENFATRRRLAGGAPVTIAASAVLQHSGEVTLFVTADPLSKVLRFAGELEVKHLKLDDLYGIVVARTGLHMPSGTFELLASFKEEHGKVTGGVRPILKDVKVEAVDKSLGTKLKAGLADASLNLLSNEQQGQKLVGTTVPIKGDIRNPDVQLYPALIGVLRNAFVESLSQSFANLPPQTAPEKRGIIEQTVKGLSKEKHAEPKAQPEKP